MYTCKWKDKHFVVKHEIWFKMASMFDDIQFIQNDYQWRTSRNEHFSQLELKFWIKFRIFRIFRLNT